MGKRTKKSEKVVFQNEGGSKTRKGTRPNDSKKRPVPGSGRNRPAKGYDQVTGTWNN